MANSNIRLAKAGAPALLREFALNLDFEAVVRLPADHCTLLLGRVARPNTQMTALMGNTIANVRLEARFIAAPSLQPPPPQGEVCDP